MLRRALPALVMALLLVSLAVLQYRWIGEASRVERERLVARAERAGNNAAQRFDEDLADLYLALSPMEEDSLPAHVAAWRAEASDPRLLDSVYLLSAVALQPSPRRSATMLQLLDETSGTFEAAQWTERLAPLQRAFQKERRTPDRGFAFPGSVEPSLPALLLSTELRRRRGPAAESRQVIALVLDREALARLVERVVFSELDERLGDDFFYRVVDEHSAVVASTADSDSWQGDVSRFPVLRLLPPEELRRRLAENVLNRLAERGLPPPPGTERIDKRGQAPGSSRAGPWAIELMHRTGSMSAAVASLRTRNLMISGGVLLLLAASIVTVVRTAGRDRRMARQQIDFVAGITHELHTPLAAIAAAGANLSDGIVTEPARVREYGDLLQRETGRLDHLVRQALVLAELESTDKEGDIVDLREITNVVAPSLLLLAERNGVELEFIPRPSSSVNPRASLAEPILVRGTLEGIERVLSNLVGNSIKFGARRVCVLLQTSATRGVLRVIDDGPGIQPLDAHRIFEPYRRGEGAATVPGSGLGLYLARRIVERYGGQLRLEGAGLEAGVGCTFEITLPTVPRTQSPSVPPLDDGGPA